MPPSSLRLSHTHTHTKRVSHEKFFTSKYLPLFEARSILVTWNLKLSVVVALLHWSCSSSSKKKRQKKESSICVSSRHCIYFVSATGCVRSSDQVCVGRLTFFLARLKPPFLQLLALNETGFAVLIALQSVHPLSLFSFQSKLGFISHIWHSRNARAFFFLPSFLPTSRNCWHLLAGKNGKKVTFTHVTEVTPMTG